MLGHGEIQALITLLGDDDPHVRNIAREQLLQNGEAAAEFLRAAGSADGDGKIRIEARNVLAQIQQEDLAGSFYLLSLLDDDQIDLEQAVFLLARLGYPDLDMARYQRQLDQLAQAISQRLAGLHHHRDRGHVLRVMNQVLFDEEGFSGNIKDYYDPGNSFLNCVLERRTGIPITLSVIYLLVGRRLRLPIRGINMPAHFICQYHSPPESFYFDPFNKGRVLTRLDCAKLLQQARQPFHESLLAPAGAHDIIARMIRNLLVIYHHHDDHDQIERLGRILKMFEPPLDKHEEKK
jgi:regulator of sirC expression with transglutaminase-like and TPR domain